MMLVITRSSQPATRAGSDSKKFAIEVLVLTIHEATSATAWTSKFFKAVAACTNQAASRAGKLVKKLLMEVLILTSHSPIFWPASKDHRIIVPSALPNQYPSL